MSKFEVGKKYEMYIPAAKELEAIGFITFDDNITYQFTCTSDAKGMLWTKDIHYHGVRQLGIPSPPPPHPQWGSPVDIGWMGAVREATDEPVH